MQRRSFIQSVAAALAVATTGIRDVWPMGRPKVSFRHGVASGDPTAHGVIIWTRVTTIDHRAVRVTWQIATDRAMRNIVQDGSLVTDAARDFTVKFDVTGLSAGQKYFYRFSCNRQKSALGSTRTLPQGPVAEARFAVVSCSNYPAGYFNAYRDIAEHGDLDAVLHLGDYIYEYGLGDYATEYAETLDRVPEPPTEIVSLAEYRARHAQYKADEDAQAMHAALPMIAIWDDHELANDSWQNGAQNHQANEGRWEERRDAALQAWFEWMPVRGTPQGAQTRIYRDFRWGDLVSLIMLDTRFIGRDIQPNVGDEVTAESIGAALRDGGRRMLGAEQEAWLRERLQESTDTTWQVLGQQVMVARMEPPDLDPLVDRDRPSFFSPEQLDASIAASKSHHPQILDVWDGYPVAKEDFLRDLGTYARNPVVLSGDLHTAMAADLVPASGDVPVAVELMTTAVTSPGLTAYFPDKKPNGVRDATLAQNPHFHFLDIVDRGWLSVRLTHERCSGEWHLLDTVHSRSYTSRIARTVSVAAGSIKNGLA